MAHVTVNDNTYEFKTEAGNSVLDILLTAQENLWDDGKIIAAVKLNGESIDLEEETLRALPAENAELEITLMDQPQRTLKETLTEACVYLGRLATGFDELSEHLRHEQSADAYTMLKDGVDGLTSMLDLVQVLRTDQRMPDELDQSLQQFLKSFNEKSQELTDAQESGDPTLIADILEYEFVDAIKELKELVSQVADHVT